MKAAALALCAALLTGCSTLPTSRGGLKLAITIDDLPVHDEPPPGETPATVAAAMIKAVRTAGVRDAHGFVNGAWTERDPETLSILEAWRSAGLPLANHGWSHRHLNEMSLEEFEQEVARNEPLLRRLSKGDEWRWFRYPFLDEGETDAKRAAAREILARRGYRVAAVTMDFSDWQWPAVDARCHASGDTAAIERLEQLYLGAAREHARISRLTAQKLHGRDIPYVLLLHVSAITARMMPRLLAIYREAGFRFVPLSEAQQDPVYQAYQDPRLPAPPPPQQSARAKSIELPRGNNHSAKLAQMCADPRPSTPSG